MKFPRFKRKPGGKHRGVYQPSFHWSHAKCYDNGVCLLGEQKVILKPYIDAQGESLFNKAQEIDVGSGQDWAGVPTPYVGEGGDQHAYML